MPTPTRLDSQQADFQTRLDALLALEAPGDSDIPTRVSAMLADVRQRGDEAVLEYTRRFDGLDVAGMAGLILPLERCRQALDDLPAAEREALELSVDRVRRYHERQKAESWSYTDEAGVLLGQKVSAIARVGLYVPGGRAAYPSSVIMNAVPAQVAGVERLVMTTPTPRGEVNPLVLAAAALCGVDEVWAVGGAQAVAALAFGTASIGAVDKIVGPGNAYVAEAKRQVFGVVGIDMVAGPSEILIISDGSAPADWVAMDLFSQAEHDELAQSILICPDAGYLDAVAEAMDRLAPGMSRREIIEGAIDRRGALIRVRDLDEAARIANHIAPEHLELSVATPQTLLPAIRHAGAIFLGHHTSEALGDYCAGPNHVLPTSRTARFSSPLGVYDFQKRSSLIGASPEAARTLGAVAARLARGEGLEAHARSADYRVRS